MLSFVDYVPANAATNEVGGLDFYSITFHYENQALIECKDIDFEIKENQPAEAYNDEYIRKFFGAALSESEIYCLNDNDKPMRKPIVNQDNLFLNDEDSKHENDNKLPDNKDNSEINNSNSSSSNKEKSQAEKDNLLLIIILIIAAVFLVAGAIILIIIIKRK